MNLDILGNWQGGAIRDAGDEAIRNYGKDALNNIDIGLLESGFGATNDHVRNYIKNKQQGALNDSELRARAINAGLLGADGSGGADFDDTTGSYLSKIVKQEKDVKKQDRATARQEKKDDEKDALTRTLAINQQGINATAAEGRLSRESAQDQYLHSTKTQNARYAHERGENLMNKRHERELAMLSGDRQMAIAEMQEGLQDRRMDFDRETMRMDKHDFYIAQLMRGLGELAGAFA